VLWGEKDEFITPKYLERWLKRLPDAIAKTYDSGHFVPEEKSEEAIAEIHNFIRTSIQARGL
jgi:pimeloyl-ACP methyl ester carboxylesterase